MDVPIAPVPAQDLRIPGSRTLRLEGADVGAGISFFLVETAPGDGPALHRHPYDETFHVMEGAARIRIGAQTLDAGPGDTAVVPPRTWHRFTSTGEGVLRMMCIHASPVMIQEYAPEEEQG
ncbi:cupin domain-containing protein [Brachybacterium hainanense]|uniref:Cupin domain-containing protein n=1 Tax=Brachybacterium hainanense TaxID=1541174 RepID=A0ABV6RG93_9MICO